MPRPKASSRQHSDAYDLHLAGLGSLAIWESLDKRYSDVVAPRTVDNWISGFKGLNPKIKELDSPFVFNKMEDYGLPLDASAYLLQLLTSWADGRLSWWPWVRDMRWVWRVHRAAPELELPDVWGLAQMFTTRERASDLAGNPDNFEDLYAYLAIKPWINERNLETYKRAYISIAEGLMQPINVEHETTSQDDFRRSAFTLLRERDDPVTLITSRVAARLLFGHPEVLPSGWPELFLEQREKMMKEGIQIKPTREENE